MNDAHLKEYTAIFENAILSRASRHENWASISGGWDSTIVLGALCKYFDASRVRAVVSEVKLKDGRVYNPYEVEKAIRIGKYYGVPTEVASINFADVNLKKLWDDTVNAGRTDFVYTHTFLFQAMVDTIMAKGKADAAVFIGSLSDSLHNFGFSQGVSLQYLNNDFRDYSDKMMSYLYSPSFMQKVIDDTYLDDFAYNLFKNAEVGGSRLHHAGTEFTPASQMTREERIFEYLLSFVLSNSRLPFAPIANESVFSSHARSSLKEWLYINYFQEVVTQIDTENMYFWLIWLYQHFHLQGFEKSALNASLRGSGRRPCVPFYDLQLVKFLQRMPEDWGRGLEWRQTKYPLKHYGRNILKVPYDIIESGVHSYITEMEQGRNVNIFSEILNNSSLSAEMWQNVKNNTDLDKLFDKDWFNRPALNKVLEMRASEAISALPLRLLLLLSIKA
jgi:hypothetical protein